MSKERFALLNMYNFNDKFFDNENKRNLDSLDVVGILNHYDKTLSEFVKREVEKQDKISDQEAKLAEKEEQLHCKTWYKEYKKVMEANEAFYNECAKLRKQLAESEEKLKLKNEDISKLHTNLQIQGKFKNQADYENKQLKRQLAEKEEEIEMLNKFLSDKATEIEELQQRISDKITSAYGAELIARSEQFFLEKQIRELKEKEQDKISFAVDVLEEIAGCSNYINSKLDFECGSYVSEKSIRDKIKYLKGKKDE